MTVLVTGAAGFIGMHVSQALLDRGETVLGIDNINDYYDPRLKHARLDRLSARDGFSFRRMDIADRDGMATLRERGDITHIVHLAAQAGVRYSLENPYAYIEANIMGHLNVMELARALPDLNHMAYASSSSVYGGNTKIPFSVADRVDQPISLYAATKRSDELMSHCYAHLYRIPMTGLRFFTVYGPWGRPDMAAYIFAEKILKGEPIQVFNHGEMERDFTYIDDIVSGILKVLDAPPAEGSKDGEGGEAPHRVYNIGNNKPEPLMRFIGIIQDSLGRKAEIDFQPLQPGDVPRTFADIDAIRDDLGYEPTTPIDVGLPRFIEWFRGYNAR